MSVNGQLIPTGTVSVQSAANTGNDADESGDAEVEDTTDTQTGNVTVTVDLAAANTEYRNIIWALYDDDATEKQWFGAWSFPVSNYSILIDYGARKWLDGAYDSQSNSVTLTTLEGDDVVAPAGGTVVYAGELLLTGNTIVIDHGFGVRSYLFGLSEIFVSEGDVVLQNQIIATASTQTVFDVKIGNKSISPWNLISGSGGLFWNEYA